MATKKASLRLVQYIAVRGDLVKEWPLGAIVAQACHACTAALHSFREDPHTIEYLSDLDRMHKVVLSVSVCDGNQACSIMYVVTLVRILEWGYVMCN